MRQSAGIQFLPCPSNGAFVARCVGAELPCVVSLVGAGGKTSTLFWLANEMVARGRRVLMTTTTRMFLPEPGCATTVLIEPEFRQRLAALQDLPLASGIVALFSSYDASTGKVAGCRPDEVDQLKSLAAADVILVEADGARHCALKAPAEHEPCIPGSSNTVIALTSAAPLGCPADPATIHRWPQFAAITGLSAGDEIGHDALGRLLVHPNGLFKNTPPQTRRHWLVNTHGTINPLLASMLEPLAQRYLALNGLWIGDMRQSNPFSHAWVRG